MLRTTCHVPRATCALHRNHCTLNGHGPALVDFFLLTITINLLIVVLPTRATCASGHAHFSLRVPVLVRVHVRVCGYAS